MPKNDIYFLFIHQYTSYHLTHHAVFNFKHSFDSFDICYISNLKMSTEARLPCLTIYCFSDYF